VIHPASSGSQGWVPGEWGVGASMVGDGVGGVSEVVRVSGMVGAYLAVIPLHGSQGTPLPTPVHY
jgi:hypothetical protein